MEQNRPQRQTQKYLVIWFEVNMPRNEVWNNVYPVNCIVPIRYSYERYKTKCDPIYFIQKWILFGFVSRNVYNKATFRK